MVLAYESGFPPVEEQEFDPLVGSEEFLSVMIQDFYTPHRLNSFPICLVKKPVGECDDGVPEIFVLA